MAKKNETPEEMFLRIARRRTNKVMEELRLLSNLMKPYYKSTPKQRENIVNTIQAGLDDLRHIYEGVESDRKPFKTELGI